MIIVNIFTLLNLLILSLLVGIREVNSRANKVLAWIIVLPGSAFAINVLTYSGFIAQVPWILGLNVGLLWGPFILWYVKLVMKEKVSITLKTSWHLIPMLISLIYGIYLGLQDAAFSRQLSEDLMHYQFPWHVLAINAMTMLQLFSYLGYAAFSVFRYKEDGGSREQALRIGWLKQFVLLLLGLNVCLIVCYFIINPAVVDYYVVPLLYDVFYFYVVYKSFRSSGIFSDVSYAVISREEAVVKEKYSNSLLKEEQVTGYKHELLRFMDAEQPYTDPELGLGSLAAATNIPQHYLSQIINQEFNKNFFDFVNAYRIDKAKALMKDLSTQNLTLEAIGAQSGFGSPSAFYRAFKKHTGTTPSIYLKS